MEIATHREALDAMSHRIYKRLAYVLSLCIFVYLLIDVSIAYLSRQVAAETSLSPASEAIFPTIAFCFKPFFLLRKLPGRHKDIADS